MNYLLGIDLGTSSVKVVIIDAQGNIKGHGQCEYIIEYPRINFAEQNPEVWWTSSCKAIYNALQDSKLQPAQINGIGLSGQMHGLVCVDEKGAVLRNAIIWCDRRSREEVSYIHSLFSPIQLGKLVANPLLPGFFVASLLWIQRKEPHVYKRIYKILLPKDFIRFKLTGKMETDITDAASTLIFDVKNSKWSEELITTLRLDEKIFPSFGKSFAVAGELTTLAAKETNLIKGTPVVFGGADQPVQALGNGIVDVDTGTLTIGSGGQFFFQLNKFWYDSELKTHTFNNILPNSWYLMGAVPNCGTALRWCVKDLFGLTSYSESDMFAASVLPGCDKLFFLPYLLGDRCPRLMANSCGVFWGLKAKHTRSHLIRAVMEGISFSLKDVFVYLNQKKELPKKIIITGGGAQSEFWVQMIVDILGIPMKRSLMREQAGIGAAILAGLGIQSFYSLSDAVSKFVKLEEKFFYPDEENREAYFAIYQNFTKLVDRLKLNFDF
ncbi:xylulokinase [Treponema sp. OMZ 840]|uniref:xylulokinase n=1 Tax=Treponema sp. OMZ 840 TaxID=244313 RepID=UPI003D915AA4